MKENVKVFFNTHRSIIVLLGVVIIATILILTIRTNDKNKEKELTHEEQLNVYLEEIGREWYANWYEEIKAAKKDSTKEYLSKHSSYETCIKIDLENLFRSDSQMAEKYKDKFVNDKTNENCNMTETKVTICPKDPYEKEDYDIEIKVSCDY